MHHTVYLVEHWNLMSGTRLLIFCGGANVTDGDTDRRDRVTAIQWSNEHVPYFHSDI
jgi:hypothetical protein